MGERVFIAGGAVEVIRAVNELGGRANGVEAKLSGGRLNEEAGAGGIGGGAAGVSAVGERERETELERCGFEDARGRVTVREAENGAETGAGSRSGGVGTSDSDEGDESVTESEPEAAPESAESDRWIISEGKIPVSSIRSGEGAIASGSE
jgi:hypothetical protein